MEFKCAALAAASAIMAAAFVGCSCARSVDNSMDDLNQIEMQSDVTVSSAETTETTTEAATDVTTSDTTDTSDTETTETGDTVTTVSKKIQYVGQPGGQATTTKPAVVTKVVVVTVTVPKTTAATDAPAETTLATANAPDGLFTPYQDMCFTAEGVAMKAGDIQPSLGAIAKQVSDGTPSHGGSSAYIYSCDGFRVVTENMTKADGSSGEFITEIILTDDNVYTNKGVKIGSSVDTIYAAYGNSACEIVDSYTYRYKTDDGCVLDFCTNGAAVTEIRYYMTEQ